MRLAPTQVNASFKHRHNFYRLVVAIPLFFLNGTHVTKDSRKEKLFS